MRGVRAHVDGVPIPGLKRDDGRDGPVADADLHIAGEGGRAAVIEDHGPAAEGRELDDDVRCRCLAPSGDGDPGSPDRLLGQAHDQDLPGLGEGLGRDDVGRHEGRSGTRIVDVHLLDDEALGVNVDVETPVEPHRAGVQAPEARQGCETPLLLAARGHGMIGDSARANGRRVVTRRDGDGHQPTAPSICSSMSRLSSSAYSIGSSRAIGSTKPRTIMAMASSSVMPRDMR